MKTRDLFNSTNCQENKILIFENFFNSKLNFLYLNLGRKIAFNRNLIEALDYFGAYEILLLSKNIILTKIKDGKIRYITNFENLIFSVSKNILKNKSKNINFKNNLHFTQQTKHFQEDFLITNDLGAVIYNDIDNKNNHIFEHIVKHMTKLYEALSVGNIQKCLELTKYFKKIIGKFSIVH